MEYKTQKDFDQVKNFYYNINISDEGYYPYIRVSGLEIQNQCGV